jgi:hypothetical protein
LPGGDIYDFLVSSGAGAEVSLGLHWRLGVDLFLLHESNGQGLGPFNPAFDGVGMGVAMSWSGRPIAPLTTDERDDRTGARASRLPGVSLDGVVGQAGGDVLGTGHLTVAERIIDSLLVLAELEHGVFAGERLTEVGASLASHADLLSAGAYAGYRDFAGLRTRIAAGQLEWHAMSLHRSSGSSSSSATTTPAIAGSRAWACAPTFATPSW